MFPITLASVSPLHKWNALKDVKDGGTVLDVGCGNNSPAKTKRLRPDIRYIGIDVGDYAQYDDPRSVADEYCIVKPEQFADTISQHSGVCDVVISAHNIEHCIEPQRVVQAMMDALAPGGLLYISTPCPECVGFPNRQGTLNFFDDVTHREPVPLGPIADYANGRGFHVEKLCLRYRPMIPAIIGGLLEPVSSVRKQVAPYCATWALWGFESILWVRRPMQNADSNCNV